MWILYGDWEMHNALWSLYFWRFIWVSFHLYGQENISFELEKLRTELRHARGMYAIAQSETIDASLKVNVCFLLLFYWLLNPLNCCFSLENYFPRSWILTKLVNSSNEYLFVVFYYFIFSFFVFISPFIKDFNYATSLSAYI